MVRRCHGCDWLRPAGRRYQVNSELLSIKEENCICFFWKQQTVHRSRISDCLCAQMLVVDPLNVRGQPQPLWSTISSPQCSKNGWGRRQPLHCTKYIRRDCQAPQGALQMTCVREITVLHMRNQAQLASHTRGVPRTIFLSSETDHQITLHLYFHLLDLASQQVTLLALGNDKFGNHVQLEPNSHGSLSRKPVQVRRTWPDCSTERLKPKA